MDVIDPDAEMSEVKPVLCARLHTRPDHAFSNRITSLPSCFLMDVAKDSEKGWFK